jgi:hypothetical protein
MEVSTFWRSILVEIEIKSIDILKPLILSQISDIHSDYEFFMWCIFNKEILKQLIISQPVNIYIFETINHLLTVDTYHGLRIIIDLDLSWLWKPPCLVILYLSPHCVQHSAIFECHFKLSYLTTHMWVYEVQVEQT